MRLLSIEFMKVRPAKYFWILLSLFAFILAAIPIGTHALGSWIIDNLLPADLPIQNVLPLFDFADIWQNFTFIYQFFTVLISSIVAIQIAQEFSLRTARQQIIDGLSRKEFFLGKIYFLLALAAAVSLVVLVICLVFGLVYSPVTDFESIVLNIEFIPAYFLHLFHDFLWAMFIAILIRRTGIAVVVLIFYGWVEGILHAIVQFALKMEWLARLLPNGATKVLIHNPFSKYALMETQTTIAISDLAISLGYITLLLVLNYWMIKKRDL